MLEKKLRREIWALVYQQDNFSKQNGPRFDMVEEARKIKTGYKKWVWIRLTAEKKNIMGKYSPMANVHWAVTWNAAYPVLSPFSPSGT